MTIEAPPRPPAQDDPEALIPEARERQRRRQLVVALGVMLSAAAALGIYSVFANSRSVTAGAGGPRGLAGSDCRIANFAVKEIPISGAGSLYRFGLQLTNRGSACRLGGYPVVRFSDAKGTIPFLLRYLGKPRLETVPARHSIFAIEGQHRCDLGGTTRTTARTTLEFPNDPRAITFTSPLGGPSICPPGIPAEGRVVTLTPFQSLRAAGQVSDNYTAVDQ
jgi:hypothetical protein